MTGIAATCEEDVIETVRAARESHRTLEIVGAGTKRTFGRPALCDDVLDVSRIRGIVSYEPEELILTVKPGTPVAEVEELLSAKNQRLGFDPVDWGPLLGVPAIDTTMGGAISADACGSAAVRYGRARDHLLGIRAVNGLGEAYKAGGKVVKNVTGFDLPKLMCGAMGTLGPLTELTLRVVPKAPRATTLAVRDIAPANGFALLRRVWSSPLEATGLAYVAHGIVFPQIGGADEGAALIRLEGAGEALEEKIVALHALLAGNDVVEVGNAIFSQIGSGRVFAGRELDVWRIAIPPGNAAQYMAETKSNLCIGDWAGGLLWIGIGANDGGAPERLYSAAARHGGYAMLMCASEETRAGISVFQPLSPELFALTRSVKSAFDPLGLFNPGRMVDGI
jgi:glycolate dehydrogenase FAD-binding subunit